ncbi:hypothetical protein EGW08_021626 [Elysia chlorotica]|uniref:Nucleoside diphosphate-linked moiety X motif 19 n=1 Tax=Elysia chlorotica TaxID=188477 RepID=A0A3S1H205_ELYCH|nr:hypothetical protein EGW08_021626 [Elysia chlorotica]
MAAVLKHWRESATLILATSKVSQGLVVNFAGAKSSEKSVTPEQNRDWVRGSDETAYKSGTGFDVLMIKRSGKSKFMPDLHVFPGGVADDSDFSSRWLAVFKRLGSDTQKTLFSQISEKLEDACPMIARHREPEFSTLPADVAFRICAIRETFEEAGVLLARPALDSRKLVKRICTEREDHSYRAQSSGSLNTAYTHEDPQVLKTWRARVNRDAGQFLEMCLQLDLVPEIWCLKEWANWLTPIHGKENRRRFDTFFYVCCVDHKPEAEQDFGETVNVLWAPPRQLLSAYFQEKGGLGYPQIYELSRLLNFASADDLLALVSSSGRARVERWFPVLGVCTDHILTIMPGDELYPNEPDFVAQEPINFHVTLEELNRAHPSQHRNYVNSQDQIYCPLYSIKPQKGHVGPNEEGVQSILDEYKSKL